MVKMDTMEDKDFEERRQYFDVGVHEVTIKDHEVGVTPSGSEFIKFLVEDDTTEGKADPLWLTPRKPGKETSGAEISRRMLAAIAVHNKEGEAAKQKVRDSFKAITDSDQMKAKAFLDRFKGMQCWILVEEDMDSPKPKGGYYLRSSLYSYEPKPRQKTAAELVSDMTSQPATAAEIDEIPFD